MALLLEFWARPQCDSAALLAEAAAKNSMMLHFCTLQETLFSYGFVAPLMNSG